MVLQLGRGGGRQRVGLCPGSEDRVCTDAGESALGPDSSLAPHRRVCTRCHTYRPACVRSRQPVHQAAWPADGAPLTLRRRTARSGRSGPRGASPLTWRPPPARCSGPTSPTTTCRPTSRPRPLLSCGRRCRRWRPLALRAPALEPLEPILKACAPRPGLAAQPATGGNSLRAARPPPARLWLQARSCRRTCQTGRSDNFL